MGLDMRPDVEPEAWQLTCHKDSPLDDSVYISSWFACVLHLAAECCSFMGVGAWPDVDSEVWQLISKQGGSFHYR